VNRALLAVAGAATGAVIAVAASRWGGEIGPAVVMALVGAILVTAWLDRR
jgi:hypothetical protein